MKVTTRLFAWTALCGVLALAGCGDGQGAQLTKSQSALKPPDQTAAMLDKPAYGRAPRAISLSELQHKNLWYHVRLVDGETGYRYGYVRGQFRMERTTDRGVTWKPISLPVSFRLSSQSSCDGAENPQVAVVDLDTVAVYGVDGRRFFRLTTSDGGQKWQVASTDLPDSGYCVTSVSQPSRKDAWVVLSRPSSAGRPSAPMVYRIWDAGVHVAPVRVDEAQTISGLVPGAKVQAVMANLRDGDVYAILPNGQLVSYHTRDGGAHFEKRILAAPKGIAGAKATRIFAPRALEQEVTFPTIWTTTGAYGARQHIVVFRTRDGGDSYAGQICDVLLGARANAEGAPCAFVTPDYGYAIKDGRLMRTSDSGTTWLSVHSTTLEQWLESYPYVLDVDYISYTQGFVLAADAALTHTVLLATQGLRDRFAPVP
ncbi:beta propeller repeat protein [Alicyclobacillus vulcanalis]|uniref:BNR/Asp-box repeat-containing protein n=2 Tax=Alicyclobacillus TaxID=29330 RepID=A0A1N7P8Q3_9BACL|nr:hypothetical protein [Alicyclobacillus vulcanalis]SIT06930.1 hypothetical protein SAMN05421799_1129 [Alicyclobacillus vulcanalis]